MNEIRGIREAVQAVERRVNSMGGGSHATVQINGSGALAIAGLWVSALLLVIAAAMAFVCWQQAQSLDRQMTELRMRVDMAEGRAAITDAKLRKLGK
jgi:hypothetical protein